MIVHPAKFKNCCCISRASGYKPASGGTVKSHCMNHYSLQMLKKAALQKVNATPVNKTIYIV
jgi:hypothetical protein